MIHEAQMEQYLAFLEGRLAPSRFQHSLGVMQVMAELAPIYALDPAQW